MTVTIEDVMRKCNNFFVTETRVSGEIQIKGGAVINSLPFIDNQYVWIVGSTLNDGVHQVPLDDLSDEIFDGEIIGLAPPKAFLKLVSDIDEWQKKFGVEADSPYQSESFNGYSYTKKSSGTESSINWQSQFKSQLSKWRKI